MRRRRIFWGVAVLEIQISRCDGAETFGVLECFSSICVFGFAFSGANAFAFAFAVASRSICQTHFGVCIVVTNDNLLNLQVTALLAS